MRQLFILLITLSFFACKNDTGSSNTLSNVPDAPPVDPATLTIPSSCSLISAAEVKDILDTKSDVNLKDATDPTNKFSKSCFFRWDDTDTPNAGIMIQIQTNSVYSEYPEYISNYIKSKLENGEMAMGNEAPFKFSKFDASGRPGAYSFEQARFYWTLDNNYVCTLFFNVSTLNEKKMVRAAEKIIEKVNSNFAKAKK
ncbi:MAG TPA: hypothetical protein PK047_07540 [Saprospiraceae bacterium]|nr:hypothetical protein [Saprospiraceae bacterium]HRO08707.1 hypothetical protein [Saprospiraceae bacterium]HRP42018.1 hypothetical protein [Saprospiraceae bacterium]